MTTRSLKEELHDVLSTGPVTLTTIVASIITMTGMLMLAKWYWTGWIPFICMILVLATLIALMIDTPNNKRG